VNAKAHEQKEESANSDAGRVGAFCCALQERRQIAVSSVETKIIRMFNCYANQSCRLAGLTSFCARSYASAAIYVTQGSWDLTACTLLSACPSERRVDGEVGVMSQRRLIPTLSKRTITNSRRIRHSSFCLRRQLKP
jgi:hypothetical protein